MEYLYYMFLLRWVDKQKRNEWILFVVSMVFFVALCFLYPTSFKKVQRKGQLVRGWLYEKNLFVNGNQCFILIV